MNKFHPTVLIGNGVIVQSETGQQSSYCWLHNPIIWDKDDRSNRTAMA